MSGQHTAGPWERRVNENNSVIRIEEAANRGNQGLIAYVTPYTLLSITNGSIERDDGTNFANARLIAAAPEMLEALLQYVSDLRYPPTGDSIQRRIERAEAVIAKAMGK